MGNQRGIHSTLLCVCLVSYSSFCAGRFAFPRIFFSQYVDARDTLLCPIEWHSLFWKTSQLMAPQSWASPFALFHRWCRRFFTEAASQCGFGTKMYSSCRTSAKRARRQSLQPEVEHYASPVYFAFIFLSLSTECSLCDIRSICMQNCLWRCHFIFINEF